MEHTLDGDEKRQPSHSPPLSERRTQVTTPHHGLPLLRTTPGSGILALQRLAGNHAVATSMGPAVQDSSWTPAADEGLIELTVPGLANSTAAIVERSDVRARMPRFSDLKAAYSDKKLRIPQSVVKNQVAQLLGRMQVEKRLKTKDSVPTLIAKIFPAPGMVSETEFNKALDTADRTVIYQSVFDADTTVRKVDQAKLKVLMKDAGDLIAKAEGDAAGLKDVFGAQDTVAKTRYSAARGALTTVAGDLDKHVTTDYNLDDPEMFLGGWAMHSQQLMHLLVGVVKGIDPAESQTVLIHEAAHLGHGSVLDLGYYGTSAFEAMSEIDKINNAAHFEELPRRVLGTSMFSGHVFRPGTMKGGGAITRTDIVRKLASDHVQKAWDAAVDAHMWLRGVRKAWLRGNNKPFADEKPLILELSKLGDLTVHRQNPGHARVTALDVVIIESIARAMGLIGNFVGSASLPSGPWTDRGAADVMVAEAIRKYGQLLHDAGRDKVLVDWLAGHAHALPGPP